MSRVGCDRGSGPFFFFFPEAARARRGDRERSDFFPEATRLGGGSPINYGDDNIRGFLVVYI